MAEHLLPKEQIFQNWKVDETCCIVGTAFKNTGCNWKLKEIKQWIAEHHTSVNEPYFYSTKKIDRLTPLKSKEQKVFYTFFAACIGIAVAIYWKTEPYFKRKWVECEALAKAKKYAIYKDSFPNLVRYATADDIWKSYEFGASFRYFIRNVFCITSPIWGLVVAGGISKSYRDKIIGKRFSYPYDIVVERLKDQRRCPSNFDIEKDVDPLTQEDISTEKSQSPQMIYLPNYVTDVKAFMLALLRGGKKEFSDPYCRRGFTPKERKEIISQILSIFQITEDELNRCFEVTEKGEIFFGFLDPYRFENDSRALDKEGQFTQDAQQALQYCFNDLEDPMLPQIDLMIDQGIEQKVKKYKEQLLENSHFRCLINEPQLNKDHLVNFFSNINASLYIPVGSECILVPIKLTPFLLLEFFEKIFPNEIKEIENELSRIKEDLRREVRSKILGLTGFYNELRKDDRAESRISHFETMTGVFLRT